MLGILNRTPGIIHINARFHAPGKGAYSEHRSMFKEEDVLISDGTKRFSLMPGITSFGDNQDEFDHISKMGFVKDLVLEGKIELLSGSIDSDNLTKKARSAVEGDLEFQDVNAKKRGRPAKEIAKEIAGGAPVELTIERK